MILVDFVNNCICASLSKGPTFEVSVLEIQRFLRSWVKNIVFATFNVFDKGNPSLSNVATRNSIRHPVSVLWREMWTHFITITTLFISEVESCKNFKAGFLKTLFFKSSTSNAYISKSFALRRLGEVSIDPKLYLVLGSGHNSIPQKWDLFRWMYTFSFPACNFDDGYSSKRDPVAICDQLNIKNFISSANFKWATIDIKMGLYLGRVIYRSKMPLAWSLRLSHFDELQIGIGNAKNKHNEFLINRSSIVCLSAQNENW